MEAPSEVSHLQLVNKVFHVDLLREKILEYAIYEEEKKALRSSACCCRLVSKIWLQSVSRVLFKLQEPLFRFCLRQPSKNTEENEDESQLPLDYFLESMTAKKQENLLRVPPFSISLQTWHLVGKNCSRFFDCLTHCGSGLIHLTLEIFDAGRSIKLGKGTTLPKLQSLTIRTYDHQGQRLDREIADIQSIFEASQQLKSFVLFNCPFRSTLPNAFSSLVIPSTVTNVAYYGLLNECPLNLFAQSSLPEVKSLDISVSPATATAKNSSGVLNSILENVRKTLETFIYSHEYERNGDDALKTFQLPLMEKLTKLKICSSHLELEGHFSFLERLVPNLSHVELTQQTVPMFRKWTESSYFESVTSLKVSLFKEKFVTFACAHRLVNFDVGTMTSLKAAFPNLVKLEVSFYTAPEPPVFVIMMGMTKLKSLTIWVEEGHDEIESTNVFDALFLGIPADSVETLRNTPELVNNLLEDNKTASIRNLTELDSLSLNAEQSSRGFSFISDLSVDHAFLKMPRLTKLILGKGFSATPFMNNKRKGGCPRIIAAEEIY